MARELDLNSQISPTEIRHNIQFHSGLNPKLWTSSEEMRLEVRIRLLRAALAFYRFLELPRLKISDIVVTGSNASFNYTRLSDIDIHLVTDYSAAVCADLAENFFTAKKTLWNLTHHISIHGFSLEMYVEDQRSPAYSNGVYSLLKGEWLRHPEAKKPSWDDSAILHKTQHLADAIDALVENPSPDADQIADMMHRLKAMRQSGLEQGGEFSVENLAYKSLRALGYLDRLREARMRAEDDDLSL